VAFLGYFLRRLSLVIPTLLGVTIITFTLTYVLPGNPAVVKAGPLVSPEVVKELEKAMGLDQPAWVQYGRYIAGVLHGDLGQSASTGRPVLEDFKQRLPATLDALADRLTNAPPVPVAEFARIRARHPEFLRIRLRELAMNLGNGHLKPARPQTLLTA